MDLPQPNPAANLCELFQGASVSECVCCLRRGNDQYLVYCAAGVSPATPGISLLDALGSEDLHRQKRCHIALALASTHLQLHSSPWINWMWDSGSVLLPTTVDASNAQIIHPDPYVLADFDANPTASLPRMDLSFISLGIVLLELGFGKRFTQDPLWQQFPGSEKDPMTRMVIAQAWAEKMQGTTGENYALAVSWTLRNGPLEAVDQSWRRDFAENVVQRLQRCCDSLGRMT